MREELLIGLSALVLALGIGAATPSPQDVITFLDVGQGDAILLQEGTKQVLIDGGPGGVVVERLEEVMPVFDRTIEVLVMSHPQQDHFEGFLHVIDQYDVGLVLMPHVAAESKLYQSFLQLLEEKHIPYRFAWAGQSILVGEMHLSILGPVDVPQARVFTRADLNNASTIMRVDFHEMSILLTGDAEAIAEHLLVQNTAPKLLDVDVLKAGHHGSSSSTHNELLDATSPGAIVISVGKGNRFGHPTKEMLQRVAGTSLWRTDMQGSVQFLWNGAQWGVTTIPHELYN